MLKPILLLLYLCTCALLLFGDRGAIASNAVTSTEADHAIPKEFNISTKYSGWIYSSSMIGLTVASPISAYLSRSYNSLRLIGCGILLVSLSLLATTVISTDSFVLLLFCRGLIGVGSGPFIAIAPALVDDCAPITKRSLYLTFFFISLPVGFSTGFAYSTYIASHYGWRSVFIAESLFSTLLSCIALFISDPNDIRRSTNTPSGAPPLQHQNQDDAQSFSKVVVETLRQPIVGINIIARALFIGGLGGISYFGSKAARSILRLDASAADLIFGAISLFAGATGTLIGGLALQKGGHSHPTIEHALVISMLSVLLCSMFLATTFAAVQSLQQFIPGFLLAQLCMYSTATPATAVFLWAVPAASRPVALALSEVANHLLGDILVPPLLGSLQHYVHHNAGYSSASAWRVTMCACASVFCASAMVFCAGRVVVQVEKSRDEAKELLYEVLSDVEDVAIENAVVITSVGNRKYVFEGKRGNVSTDQVLEEAYLLGTSL